MRKKTTTPTPTKQARIKADGSAISANHSTPLDTLLNSFAGIDSNQARLHIKLIAEILHASPSQQARQITLVEQCRNSGFTPAETRQKIEMLLNSRVVESFITGQHIEIKATKSGGIIAKDGA